MKFTCKDCKYYLAVDVFKGICKITKNNIKPETEECGKFAKNPKCKFCVNFTESKDNEYLGKCHEKIDAYPDMNSKNCKDFAWIK